MSDLSSCCPVCNSQIAPVVIPGPQGTAGTNGAAGANGVSAFTITTAQFTSPADLTTAFTVSVANSTWCVVGQDLIIGQGPGAALANPGPCAVVVTAIPSPNAITVKNLRTVDQTVTVSSGATVSVIGQLPAVPITIAQGGTNAITKATAQVSLGLGQDSVISSGAALAQVILAAGFVQVGAIDIQLGALGVYELRGHVGIDFSGTTFTVAIRIITLRLQNITQATTIVSGRMNCQIVATTSYPTQFLVLPHFKYSAGAANDHLQLQIQIDTANTAGTLTVDSGSLEAIPLRLT